MNAPTPYHEVMQQRVTFHGHTPAEAIEKASAWACAQDPMRTAFTITVEHDPEDGTGFGDWTAIVTYGVAHISLADALRLQKGAR